MFWCLQTLQRYKNLYFPIPFYEIHVFLLFQKNEENSDNKSPWSLDVIPVNDGDSFFTAR